VQLGRSKLANWNVVVAVSVCAFLAPYCTSSRADLYLASGNCAIHGEQTGMFKVILLVDMHDTKTAPDISGLSKSLYDPVLDFTIAELENVPDDAMSLFPEIIFQKNVSLVSQIAVPLDNEHLILRGVFYLHDLFDDDFLALLGDLASRLPGSTESHNMIATRRFFDSERLGAAIVERLPRCLGLQRVLPSMRFIE
jgi:hypothetical protein